MTIRPLDNKIVVRPEKAATKVGSIHLPDAAAKDAARKAGVRGEVVYCGQGKLITDGPRAGELLPMRVMLGQKVLFQEYVGTEVEIDGEKLFIMNDDSVMAVLEG